MSAFALDEFAKMSYFDGFTTKSLFSSVVLISTDSLLSVFAIAYFLNAPGEWLGVFIQRWLVNGQEPHDPHERGARMGQFLSMLHGFMALQTGMCKIYFSVTSFFLNETELLKLPHNRIRQTIAQSTRLDA